MKILSHESFTAGLIIALVAIIAAGYSLAVYQQRNSDIEICKTELRELTEQKAEQVNQYLESKAGELDILMSFHEFAEVLKDPTNNAKIAQAKDRINELKDIIPGIGLMTNEGIIIVADIDLPGTDYSALPAFSMGVKGVTFTRYYDPLRRQDYYAVGGPFYDPQDPGTMIGVIAIDVPLGDLNEILATDNGTTTRELYLVDRDKIIITNSIFGYTPFAQSADTEGVADCFACMDEHTEDGAIIEHEEAVSEYIDYRGVEVFGTHAYAPVINACLIGEMDKAEVVSLSGGSNIFSSINVVKDNRITFSVIYLMLAIVIIWWASMCMILKKRVVRYMPFSLVGMALCMHASYVYLATQQNTGAFELFGLSVLLMTTLLLFIVTGLAVTFILLKTKTEIARILVVNLSVFFILALMDMVFKFYSYANASSDFITKWGSPSMSILLICCFWWGIYLFRENLNRTWRFSLLFMTALAGLFSVSEYFSDSSILVFLHIIAMAVVVIGSYLLVITMLADIYRKHEALDEKA